MWSDSPPVHAGRSGFGGTSVRDNIRKVMEGIAESAVRAGRDPAEVTLLAVSKTRTVTEIMEAVDAGILHIGENRVQESSAKIPLVPAHDIVWHMIGSLQSNKAKKAVILFDWIDSVDSRKLIDRISAEAERIQKTVGILIQVNISGEGAKSGVHSAEDARSLVLYAAEKERISVRGFLAIGSLGVTPEVTRCEFARMRELFDRFCEDPDTAPYMNVLSMGMSGDYTIAVEEGSTMVRVGTAIFGERL